MLPPSDVDAARLVGRETSCSAQAGSARLIEYASLGPELATAAVLVGLTTTSILFCSHFHQIEGDIAARKMSPLVRLGTRRGYEVSSPQYLSSSSLHQCMT